MTSGQFVTATYQVSAEKQDHFVGLLKQVEGVMRATGLITLWPAIRMRSKADPEYILEVFQWVDATSFERAQQTPGVLALWGQLDANWIDGGFGMNRIPESAQNWAQFDTIL